MTESGPLTTNPFSPSAVAMVGSEGEEPVTVNTQAVDEARRVLAEYVAPTAHESGSGGSRLPGAAERHGTVVTIVGDYGTGKTHLAIHLLRTAQRAAARATETGIVVHHAYLEAPADGFEHLYRDFVATLNRDDVLATLRDHFADVVANALAGSPLTEETARWLRNRQVNPETVIEQLGLIDSLLSRQFREELRRVTRNDVFGDALTMLLRRKEFADDIWNWLTGEPPTPALVDRGIREPIRGSDTSLDALGVFAYLYGRRHHRFFLVIDEMDNILTATRQPDRGAVVGFRKLFEVCKAAGAFLVVVGLPDLFDILREGARQRVDVQINMPPLTGYDVRKLIELTHHATTGEARLAPFTEAVPELIAKLTRGSARQVVRLCHRAYRDAIRQEATAITDAMVLETARTTDALPIVTDVLVQIRHILSAKGLAFERDRWIQDQGAPVGVDFWITVGARDAGCAIVVTGSVMAEADVAPLANRAHRIRTAVDGSETILVVVGYLNIDLRSALAAAFNSTPIEYGRSDLAAELTDAVDVATARIEQRQEQDLPQRILERITWINQQQIFAQAYTERIATRVDDITASIEKLSLDVRHARLDASAPEAAPVLPDGVEQVFQAAFAQLSEFTATSTLMRTALRPAADTSEAQSGQRELRARMRSPEVYSAVGVATLLRELVQAFYEGVVAWFADQPTVEAAARQDIAALCQAYEAIYYELSMDRLRSYPAAHTWADEDAFVLGWEHRQESVRDHFDELGARVQEAVLRSIDSPS